jgi:hypothetical protein
MVIFKSRCRMTIRFWVNVNRGAFKKADPQQAFITGSQRPRMVLRGVCVCACACARVCNFNGMTLLREQSYNLWFSSK